MRGQGDVTATAREITWSLVVATNSDEILENCLLRSEEVSLAKEILMQRNARNASTAYNAGLNESTGDVIVFAHQDIFLPKGWAKKLYKVIRGLTVDDPNWGVAGVYGVTACGQSAGYIYSSGLRRFVGEPFYEPIQVRCLDEMLLILRRSSGLRFDERLPGFHLYGTDICLEAEARGLRNYVVPCFAFHNSRGINWLPLTFWQAYMHLRKKWKDRLPITTVCTKITVGCTPIMDAILRACWSSVRHRNNLGSRVADPERFYNEHLAPQLKV